MTASELEASLLEAADVGEAMLTQPKEEVLAHSSADSEDQVVPKDEKVDSEPMHTCRD